MNSTVSKTWPCRGMSLVSTMVAVVILLIAVIGTSSFRYYCAMDTRRADAQAEAARIALTLCESWRGINGSLTYNPITHFGTNLAITQSSTGPEKPADFILLGSYAIDVDNTHGVTHYATLSWKDVQPGLRALNVVVAWAQRGAGVNSPEVVDKSYKLTIYTSTT